MIADVWTAVAWRDGDSDAEQGRITTPAHAADAAFQTWLQIDVAGSQTARRVARYFRHGDARARQGLAARLVLGLRSGSTGGPRGDLPVPEVYYNLLKLVCTQREIWHTVYNHVMAEPQAIVEWYKRSALQPYLSPLDTALRAEFLAAYTAKIAAAYKPRFDGKVLLRFPRLFLLAVRQPARSLWPFRSYTSFTVVARCTVA
jgi:trans-aconitate methyltransferase